MKKKLEDMKGGDTYTIKGRTVTIIDVLQGHIIALDEQGRRYMRALSKGNSPTAPRWHKVSCVPR